MLSLYDMHCIFLLAITLLHMVLGPFHVFLRFCSFYFWFDVFDFYSGFLFFAFCLLITSFGILMFRSCTKTLLFGHLKAFYLNNFLSPSVFLIFPTSYHVIVSYSNYSCIRKIVVLIDFYQLGCIKNGTLDGAFEICDLQTLLKLNDVAL